jgi:hypothetical protein
MFIKAIVIKLLHDLFLVSQLPSERVDFGLLLKEWRLSWRESRYCLVFPCSLYCLCSSFLVQQKRKLNQLVIKSIFLKKYIKLFFLKNLILKLFKIINLIFFQDKYIFNTYKHNFKYKTPLKNLRPRLFAGK